VSYQRRASGLYVPSSCTHVQRLAPQDHVGHVEGWVRAYLKDERDDSPGLGELAWEGHNLFTSAGYGRLASFLAAASANPAVAAPNYIAVGTSGTAANAADTGLGQELYRAVLVSASVSSLYTARLAANFAAGIATGNILEAGLLDNAGYPTTGATGTASSYTTTTLTDSGAAWATNAWAGGYLYVVTATTNASQRAAIASNTATVLTFSAPITLPTGTVTYRISIPYLFAHATMNVNKGASQSLNVTWQVTVPSQ